MLGLVTFAALGYHIFSVVRLLQTHDDSADK
jgi:hypothetical protein